MPDTAAGTVAAPALPPGVEVDAAAVRAAGSLLAPLGRPIADEGEQVVRAWRGIGRCYLAPETPVLLAALDPVSPITEVLARRVTGVGGALTVWAERIGPVIDELRTLAAAGRVTPEQAGRMTALIGELAAAERACAAAIAAYTDTDLEPDPVRTGEQSGKGEARLSVGTVTLQGGTQLTVTTFSDGTVTITAQDSAGLGGTFPAGPVDADGRLVGEFSRTWQAQDATEAARLLEELRRYEERVQQPYTSGKGAYPAAALVPRLVRPPDSVSWVGGGEVSAEAEADTAGADLSAEGKISWTTTQDYTDGSTTTVRTTRGSVEAAGSVPAGPGGAGGKAEIELTREVTTDATGQITEVQLTRTETVGVSATARVGPPQVAGALEHEESTVRVTTTTLEVDEDNRGAVEEWARAGRPDIATPAGVDKVHRPDTAEPGDPFQNLLHAEADVSEVTSHVTTDRQGLEAGLDKPEAEAEVTDERTSSRAVSASHLGAPGPDGVRRSVPGDLAH